MASEGRGGSADERRGHVLVVMPPGGERRLAVQILDAPRLEIVVADEPFEGIRAFLESSIDLVVLSLDGLVSRDTSFVDQVQRISPAVRILLLVPEGRRRLGVRFMKAGADAMLPIPFLASELHFVVEALLRPSGRDALTGLASRTAYHAACPREILRADREGATLGLGLIDLDRFGEHNTELGYQRADDLIVATARLLASEARQTDLVARWGGDEFVVLLIGLPQEAEEARQMGGQTMDRIRARLASSPIPVRDHGDRPVTLSGGLSLFPHDLPAKPKGHMDDAQARTACEDLFEVANNRLRIAKTLPGRQGKDGEPEGGNAVVFGDADKHRLLPSDDEQQATG